MLKLHQIRRAHVELTTRCNARCPMCPRNYRGVDFNSGYPITELRLQDFVKIFSSNFLRQLRPSEHPIMKPPYYENCGISFNGNLGDFSLARDSAEIVSYVVEHGVPVLINTNGSTRTPDWWARLALPGVTIGFALDGLEDTHHLYRQDTDWKKIISNARAYIDAGGHAIWRFAPFEHNRHQEKDCQKLAAELGFSEFDNIYDGRDKGPAFNRDGSFSHHIGQRTAQEQGPEPDIESLLTSHRTWFRLDQAHEKDGSLNITCKHKRSEEIYVAADGSVYPCCFLGFYPNTMNHPGNQQLLPLIKENNALEYDLAHCLEWFDRVEETWQKDSVREGRLYQCAHHCGTRP